MFFFVPILLAVLAVDGTIAPQRLHLFTSNKIGLEQIMPEDLYNYLFNKQYFSKTVVQPACCNSKPDDPNFNKDQIYVSPYEFQNKYSETPTVKRLKPKTESERKFRIEVVKQNMNFIYGKSGKRGNYNIRVNEFAYLFEAQFLQYYANLQVPLRSNFKNTINFQREQYQRFTQLSPFLIEQELGKPKTFNEKVSHCCNAGPVSHQGICGSCYAFATADAAAIIRAIYSDLPYYIPLSTQEIVSSYYKNTYGCAGGTLSSAFDYMIDKGLYYAWSYPYRNQESNIANVALVIGAGVWKVKSFEGRRLISNDCFDVLTVLKRKPLAVAIAVTFQMAFYYSGTITGTSRKLNHGVVLIGYDPKYGYHFKNSWGTEWGDSGFGWLNTTDNAGICNYAVEVVLSEEK